MLGDETLDLRDRVAGSLVLLYAQPLSRIARLRHTDLERRDGRSYLALGPHPAPLPEVLAALVDRLARVPASATTGATRPSPWLFPGKKLGEPLDYRRLSIRMRRLGIATTPGRIGALAHLLHHVPGPVLARQIGISPTTADKWATRLAVAYAATSPAARDASRPVSILRCVAAGTRTSCVHVVLGH